MALRIKNWEKFQHYKHRKPPWIKLYRDLLEDKQWNELSGDAAKCLIMLWMIASESEGYLPDIEVLAFRLRRSEKEVKSLLSECYHWIEDDASVMLATCEQDATSEKRRVEAETEESDASTMLAEERIEMRRRTFEAICHRYGLAPDPKGYGSWSELAGICEGLGDRAVESAFEEWASKGPNVGKPISAFVKIAPTLANKMVVIEQNPKLEDFCFYVSDKSDMQIIFNKAQKAEVSEILDNYPYSEILLAFDKFYGIIENDSYQLKFGAKDFVEKGPQILEIMRRRKLEAEAQEKQIAEIKSKVAKEGAAMVAGSDLETISDEDVLRDLGFEKGA